MITEDERKELKSISNIDYARDIAQKLNDAGIRPLRSEKYTNRTITRVLRGEQDDINAELAIYQHYHDIKNKKHELEKLKRIKIKNGKEPENHQ